MPSVSCRCLGSQDVRYSMLLNELESMRALLKQSQAQITKLYVDLYFIIQPNNLSLISRGVL